MPKKQKYTEALKLVMGLSYARTTMNVATSKAIGHQLAKPVLAKGSQPSRPVALVDGLAVLSADVIAATSLPDATADSGAMSQEADAAAPADQSQDKLEEHGLGATEGQPEKPQDEQPLVSNEPPAAVVELTLRPFPETNRREDALCSGQAIAVPIGGEVPRGSDLVLPFSEIISEIGNSSTTEQVETPQSIVPPAEGSDTKGELEPAVGDGNDNDNGHDEDDGELPVAEPAKDWDLVSRHLSGTVTLQQLPADTPRNLVSIGDWARNRGTLIQEKTVLRPPEIAMLLSLGVEHVDVYRRPVMGVASLGLPFPTAGHAGEKEPRESTCPVASLATYLARSARVAALPLGFAPQRFHHLVRAVKHWISQVDILVLVGGSHHGVSCCGLDVLDAAGSVELSGVELVPGGSLSVGKVQGKPVVVLPGALPDVLTGFVLIVRPMAHKYLTPYLYADQLPVTLTHGSQLNVEVDAAVPVRISFDEVLGKHVTHYQGRPRDPWLDYTRGQALVLLEAGRSYADDEVVTAYRY